MASLHAPQPDIGALRAVLVDHYVELVNARRIMDLLPPTISLQTQTASPNGRIQAVNELLLLRTRNPALQSALTDFAAQWEIGHEITAQDDTLLGIDWSMLPATPHFVGRKDELAQLNRSLLAPAPHSVVISGFEGMGKSTLARQAVADSAVAARFNVVWVPCHGVRDLRILRRQIGERLQYTSSLRTASRSPHQAWMVGQADASLYPPSSNGVATLLGDNALGLEGERRSSTHPERLLIVLDNVDALVEAHRGDWRREQELEHFWLQLQKKSVLLMTAIQRMNLGRDYTYLSVGRLWDYEAELLLARLCPPESLDASDASLVIQDEFMAHFEGWPLALAMAARQAPAIGGLRVFNRLLAERSETQDQLDVIMHVAFQTACNANPKLRRLLHVLAYWSSKTDRWHGCPCDFLSGALDLGGEDQTIALAAVAVEQGLVEEIIDIPGEPSFRIVDTFTKRLQTIEPCPLMKRDNLWRFCFDGLFRKARPRLLSRWRELFTDMDSIFADALCDARDDMRSSALYAILRAPTVVGRDYVASFPFDFNVGSLYGEAFPALLAVSPFSAKTLRLVVQQATSVSSEEKGTLLHLVFLEQLLNDILCYGESDLLVSTVESDEDAGRAVVEEALDTISQRLRAGGDFGRKVRCKISFLQGQLAIVDAGLSTGDQRHAFLRQARQLLTTSLVTAAPLIPSVDEDDFPTAPFSAFDILPIFSANATCVQIFMQGIAIKGGSASESEVHEVASYADHVLSRSRGCQDEPPPATGPRPASASGHPNPPINPQKATSEGSKARLWIDRSRLSWEGSR